MYHINNNVFSCVLKVVRLQITDYRLQIYFLNMIRVIEVAILRNCLKDEVDLTSDSMCLEIGLLTSEIIYHNVV